MFEIIIAINNNNNNYDNHLFKKKKYTIHLQLCDTDHIMTSTEIYYPICV